LNFERKRMGYKKKNAGWEFQAAMPLRNSAVLPQSGRTSLTFIIPSIFDAVEHRFRQKNAASEILDRLLQPTKRPGRLAADIPSLIALRGKSTRKN